MKKTALYDEHIKLNAKIVEFAGWKMPVVYSSINEEHLATRSAAGLFDISHMGEIKLSGEKAVELLEKLIPTSLKKISPGKSMYTCFCNENGGVIDDLFVFMVDHETFYLVVNAANTEKNLNWIKEHNDLNVQVTDKSDQISKIDIQGPLSLDILKDIFDKDFIESIGRFKFKKIKYNESNLVISCTGYTAEHGYELFIDNQNAKELWNHLLDAGKPYHLKPAGLGARDTLRLEACYSLYGHELNESISPFEAGIGWIVSSQAEYIGKEVLLQKKEHGTLCQINAFELLEKGIPREKYRLLKDDHDIGFCTSGGYSPTFKKGIGLALLKTNSVAPGDRIEVLIRDKKVKGVIVKKPFYKFNIRL